MPRRQVGSVIRRRLPGKGPGGKPRYAPGYYVRLRRRGRDIRRYGGPDRATALALLEKIQREVDREYLLGEVKESDITFEAFVPRYLEHARREQTPLAYNSVRALIPNRLGPFFNTMRLRTVSPAEIERYLATRRNVVGPTRNRELSALSGIFRYAQDLGIVRRNPAKDVRRSSEPQAPLPLVPLAEQQDLIDAVREPYRLLALLGLETGMRLGEMLRLEWRDIDFSTNSILVRESKSIPLQLLHRFATGSNWKVGDELPLEWVASLWSPSLLRVQYRQIQGLVAALFADRREDADPTIAELEDRDGLGTSGDRTFLITTLVRRSE